jgi:predicted secreted protein with PEFG-CTERM motif
MKYFLFVFLMVFLILQNQIYADESKYMLNTNDQTFEIAYSLDGQVIAMAIDDELNSLLVGITEVKDSAFQIMLPHDLISAENNEFTVLVDQIAVDYNISAQDNSVTLYFFVPSDSEEIEIIGTHVIPEFPLGVLVVFATMIVIVTLVTKTGKLRIR